MNQVADYVTMVAGASIGQTFKSHDIDGMDLQTMIKMKIPELISALDFMGVSSMHTILKLIRKIKAD